MEKYLLNLTTGIICKDGTSQNDMMVLAEEIIKNDTVELVIDMLDGEIKKAILTLDEYFEGKEFKINL